MSIKQIIEDTKSILQTRGRCTGDLIRNIGGRCCLLGAVGLAAGVSEEELYDGDYSWAKEEPAVRELALGVEKDLGGYSEEDLEYEAQGGIAYEKVYRFNDYTESDDDVYALLDSVIAGL